MSKERDKKRVSREGLKNIERFGEKKNRVHDKGKRMREDALKTFNDNFPKFSKKLEKEINKQEGYHVERIYHRPFMKNAEEIRAVILKKTYFPGGYGPMEPLLGITERKDISIGGVDLQNGKFRSASYFNKYEKIVYVTGPLELAADILTGAKIAKLVGRFLLKGVGRLVTKEGIQSLSAKVGKEAVETGVGKSALKIEKPRNIAPDLGKTLKTPKKPSMKSPGKPPRERLAPTKPLREIKSTPEGAVAQKGELLVASGSELPEKILLQELTKLSKAWKSGEIKNVKAFKNKIAELVGEAGARRFALSLKGYIKEIRIPRRGKKGPPILDIVAKTKDKRYIIIEAKSEFSKLGYVRKQRIHASDKSGTGEVQILTGEKSVRQMNPEWLRDRIHEIRKADKNLGRRLQREFDRGKLEGYTVNTTIKGEIKKYKDHTIEWRRYKEKGEIFGKKSKEREIKKKSREIPKIRESKPKTRQREVKRLEIKQP